MRTTAALLATGLLAAACGGDKKNPGKDDANTVIDTPMQTVDSAPLPKCTPVNGTTIKTRKLAQKVNGGAMLVTSPPNDGRLFVVEQGGRIRVYEDEQLKADPFLDITAEPGVNFISGGELGLLGLAFDPQYAFNGEFYVWYTMRNGSTYRDVLARYKVSATDPNKADPAGTQVLVIDDPYSNHNGGMLDFGADGFLYVGTGDGGSAGDPQTRAQSLNSLLGKYLRLDVSHRPTGKEYGIPSDNPFVAGGGMPEIFIIGVRNPWRWSFDRQTGDMWIGDVGQDQIEELDVLKAGQQNGGAGTPLNLGWNIFEADACFNNNAGCANRAGKVFPLDTRNHNTNWRAIIGGQVYRGTCYPDIDGWYFYTDNTNGGLVRATMKGDGTLDIAQLTGTFPGGPASIHADARGELYETDTGGNVYHIEAGP